MKQAYSVIQMAGAVLCMIIPIIFWGKSFEAGKKLDSVNIKDIAPTVADVLSINKPRDWEGKSILE